MRPLHAEVGEEHAGIKHGENHVQNKDDGEGLEGLLHYVAFVAHLVDRRAGGGMERFVLGVDVEGEEVPGARPAEVGGRNGLKARENRGGKNRRGGTSQEGESRLGGVGGGGRESVRHDMDLGLWPEPPRNRRSLYLQENPRSAGSSLKKFSVSLRQHFARHPLDVQAAPPAAGAGVELGESVRSHHDFDYTENAGMRHRAFVVVTHKNQPDLRN